MKTPNVKTAMILSATCLIILAGNIFAGDLEPVAAPASTMKTLDEVEPRIPIPGSDTSVGQFTISQSGSYYLTGDRLCSDTGIRIEANDVTVDLMGYTLTGSGASYGVHIYSGGNVEVRNGTVRGFQNGILQSNVSYYNCRAINITAESNTINGIYIYGRDCRIENCAIFNNGVSVADTYVYGIYAGANGRVLGNRVFKNGSQASGHYYVVGIYANYGCDISNNVINDNGASSTDSSKVFGIRAGAQCTISENQIVSNGSSAEDTVYGIYAGSDCVIRDNLCQSNGDGAGTTVYGMQVIDSCNVTGNSINSNAYNACSFVYGLYCGTGCIISANTVNGNGIYADEDVWGIYTMNDCVITGNTVRNNGTLSTGGIVYGVRAYTGSSVIDNVVNNNGVSVSGGGYGIYLAGNNFADRNVAYGNLGANMNTSATSTYGTNHAP